VSGAPVVAPRRALWAWRTVLVSALVAEAVTVVVGVHSTWHRAPFWLYAVSFPIFVLALIALAFSRIDLRRALIGVVAIGAVLQILALMKPPISSDDAYRYGWDAKVQLAGIDPYSYAPVDPQLDRLRSTTLFAPDSGRCAWPLPNNVCSRINRPTVHTIYPPVAEAAFTLGRIVSFARTDGPVPMQIFAALGATALSWLLAVRAWRRRRPAWTVAVWAWCPMTAVELGNNAHIDWLAVLLSVLALMFGRRILDSPAGRRPAAITGALVGAAIATKIYPALIGASLLRRHPFRVIAAAAVAFLLGYVPHVIAVGSDVVGFLPDYVKQENYLSGGRFLVLSLFVPKRFALDVAVILIVATILWAVRRSDPRAPENTAVIVFGVVLMVTTPVYSWYALMLLALVALSGRVEWLPMVLGAGLSMVGALLVTDGVQMHRVVYSIAAVTTGILLLGTAWWARRAAGPASSAAPSSAASSSAASSASPSASPSLGSPSAASPSAASSAAS
jgi:Glycosyltransferase family 87